MVQPHVLVSNFAMKQSGSFATDSYQHTAAAEPGLKSATCNNGRE